MCLFLTHQTHPQLPFLKLYSQYYAGYHDANALLQKLAEKSSLNHFLEVWQWSRTPMPHYLTFYLIQIPLLNIHQKVKDTQHILDIFALLIMPIQVRCLLITWCCIDVTWNLHLTPLSYEFSWSYVLFVYLKYYYYCCHFDREYRVIGYCWRYINIHTDVFNEWRWC